MRLGHRQVQRGDHVRTEGTAVGKPRGEVIKSTCGHLGLTFSLPNGDNRTLL